MLSRRTDDRRNHSERMIIMQRRRRQQRRVSLQLQNAGYGLLFLLGCCQHVSLEAFSVSGPVNFRAAFDGPASRDKPYSWNQARPAKSTSQQFMSSTTTTTGTASTTAEKEPSTKPSTSSSSASSSPSSLALRSIPVGSTVTVVDPETGVEVILLGCFHGAVSSAADVQACFMAANPNVIVLELCPNRFADLRREVLRQQEQEKGQRLPTDENQESSTSMKNKLATRTNNKSLWIKGYGNMVQRTAASRGFSTAAAAAVLGLVSVMQTALSGLEPGLEFSTALQLAMETNNNNAASAAPERLSSNSNNNNNTIMSTWNGKDDTVALSLSSTTSTRGGIDFILADQPVDETLQKIGQLPHYSAALWKELLTTGNWKDTFGRESDALVTALTGFPLSTSSSSDSISRCSRPLTLFGFLTRSPAAIQDMVRLMLPPVLIVQTLLLLSSVLGDVFLNALAHTTDPAIAAAISAAMMAAESSSASSSTLPVTDTILVLLANAFFLGTVGYLTVALPAAKVILRERDDRLTAGIRAACRVAAAAAARTTTTEQPPPPPQQQHQQQHADKKTARVLAVLGLLHVNGIAQRLSLPVKDHDGGSNGGDSC